MRGFTATMVLGFVMLVSPAVATDAHADQPAIEPDAVRILKRMTDFVGELQRFSLDTESILEEVLVSGQKIQHDFTARVAIQRPDKLRAERTGDRLDQLFLYDGKTFTIEDRLAGYYAVSDAPNNIDDLLHFARDTLDIVPPSGDMVFTNAFDLLTAAVTSGMVVGKSIVGGVRCDHLAFTTAVVDWQIWIADGDRPLPYKYVLTTRNDPAQPQFIVLMSNWNVTPKLSNTLFSFSVPKGSKKIDFIRMDTGHKFER